MNKPLISIITVSYNAESTIEETILSVLNQTYPNIEYIIIDGGSLDKTVEIIKKYSDKISYWRSEPDNGIYDAMNKGLHVAAGEWCLFLGADDIFYSSNVLFEFSKKINYKEKIYYGDVLMKHKNITYRGEVTSTYQLYEKNICHQAIFYPYNIYKHKRYDIRYKILADKVYNWDLYRKYPKNFEYLNMTISIFNDTGISSNSIQDIQFNKDKKLLTILLLKWDILLLIKKKILNKLKKLYHKQ